MWGICLQRHLTSAMACTVRYKKTGNCRGRSVVKLFADLPGMPLKDSRISWEKQVVISLQIKWIKCILPVMFSSKSEICPGLRPFHACTQQCASELIKMLSQLVWQMALISSHGVCVRNASGACESQVGMWAGALQCPATRTCERASFWPQHSFDIAYHTITWRDCFVAQSPPFFYSTPPHTHTDTYPPLCVSVCQSFNCTEFCSALFHVGICMQCQHCCIPLVEASTSKLSVS